MADLTYEEIITNEDGTIEVSETDAFLKAEQALALSNQTKDELNAEAIAKTQAWMIGDCETAIRSICEKTGDTTVLLVLPTGIDPLYLGNELYAAGYKVSFLNSYQQVQINWSATAIAAATPSIPNDEQSDEAAE